MIVSAGVILKYAIMGIYTESPQVTFPIMMLVLFSRCHIYYFKSF